MNIEYRIKKLKTFAKRHARVNTIAHSQSLDVVAKELGFASGKFNLGVCPHDKGKQCRGQRGNLTALRILRISEEDYLEFLQKWVSWLSRSGIARSAAA